MIQKLALISEEFTPHGNVAAEGILNQLGSPGLDLLSLLVRETVQNSLDARLVEGGTVHFTIGGRTLTTEQLEFLRTKVLSQAPERLNLQDRLYAATTGEAQVLVISDRGTSGLDGPTRANAPDDASGSRNFVNFFFNTGQSKGKQFSGGTYGYGKSILFRISQIHTICVHTRCLVEGRPESRFMAAALEPHNGGEGVGYRRHTGRHWWGYINSGDDILDPVVGQCADEIARELGLPLFNEDELGTTCAILLPVLGNFSLHAAMLRISRLLLWYAWPAMIPRTAYVPAIEFSVFCDGKTIPIPSPRSYPPLDGFVQAMKLLDRNPEDRQDYMWQVTSIASQRPKRLLGRLALQRFLFEEREKHALHDVDDAIGEIFPISGASHHVALMRNTDLVVKYLEGEPLPGSHFEYAGVFVVDRAIDAIFAKAEPPTHDDWNPQTITNRQDKTSVNVALREIRKTLTDFTAPLPVAGLEGEVLPLGTFADQLAGFMIGIKGSAAYIPLTTDRPGTAMYQHKTPVSEPSAGGDDHDTLLLPADQPVQGEKEDELRPDSSSAFGPPDVLFGPDDLDGQSPPGTISDSDRGAKDADDKGHGQGHQEPAHKFRKQAGITLLDEGHLELFGDTPVLSTSFKVEHATDSRATDVEIQASIVLDNGAEEADPPADRSQPEVIFWTSSEGKERSGSDAVRIPSRDTGIWKVAVSVPDDAIIRLNLTVSEVF